MMSPDAGRGGQTTALAASRRHGCDGCPAAAVIDPFHLNPRYPMNMLTSQWNPLREFEEMQDRVLRSLGASRRVPEGQQSLTTAEWAPLVDISEDAQEYLVKAELPEVNKDDVKVTFENGVVTIKGERRLEKEDKDKKFHRIERSYGTFVRSFTLPEDADPGKITADFKDGVLWVHLAKSEEKMPKCIEVTVN